MTSDSQPVVSVIVPARNEEECLGSCLESLVSQAGINFELIVVDDASTDRTAEIARSFSPSPDVDALGHTSHGVAGVPARPTLSVISAPPLPENWTGKNNAMSSGAKIARAKWLLFTDADTVHKPGSLARAVAEAEQHGAALLSYSPEQEVHGFWEMAVMPVIFAELAATYPPKKVNDPASPNAAANGQYLLISREAYDAVGGHTKIAGDLLEDVAMARLVKSSGRKIFFRYGGDAVRTRMYRSFPQLREGWTKNLALLFRRPQLLAWNVGFYYWMTLGGLLLIALGMSGLATHRRISSVAVIFMLFPVSAWLRIRMANFSIMTTTLATLFGPPVFIHLLLRSISRRRNGTITWKDRHYLPLPLH
jgi:GT2 family glycosyltransferase